MSTSLASALAEVASNPDISFSRLKELAGDLNASLEAGKIPVFYSGFLPSEADLNGNSFHTGALGTALGNSGRFGTLENTDVGRFLNNVTVKNRFSVLISRFRGFEERN